MGSMGLFGKRGDSADIIDYTELQKRGILKLKMPEKREDLKMDAEGFVDFSAINNTQNPASATDAFSGLSTSSSVGLSANSGSNSTADSSSAFSNFFGDMGAVAASAPSALDAASSQPQITLEMPAEFSNFKIKVDDLEFKLDRLIDKFTLIEDKLKEIENKARGI